MYTKGPWRYEEEPGAAMGRITDGKVIVAGIPTPVDVGCPETLANAHLIASAPTLKAENEQLKVGNAEMLEALERVVREMKVFYPTTQFVFAETVINEARGGNNPLPLPFGQDLNALQGK